MIGTVVEESLKDNRFINKLDVKSVRISDSEEPEDRWHLYKVNITETQIQELANQLKPEKWYAHFWDGQDILAVFSGKTFKFSRTDKSTWKLAIEYGKSIGIPTEQLDFLIDEDRAGNT